MKEKGIAVGIPVTRHPRTDPYVRNYLIQQAPPILRFGKPVAGSLPTVVRSYKSAVTRHINILRNTPGNKLWQRNYWEHIIRNNPTRWQEDALHPDQPPFPGETHKSSPPYGDEVWMV
ncbi:MAG: hypothetical protein D3905_04465 [Candidatus Electrothrix sp. AS4_5]|nr:hypothetical protein [Candidatus Electrothrix gigas]